MTIRNDLTINWDVSPRIITVASPSIEITIQDLYDTCMSIEAESDAMDDDHIIDAAGKEALGGGTSVGLTATLLNALVAFEARPGPTYEQCNVSGGNLVALEDDLVTYYATPISPTAFTQVVTTASSSATTQSQAQLEHSTYGGGVSIDVTSSFSGTDYPVGTPSSPVNNLADAHTIAHDPTRGFNKFFVKGNLIVVNEDVSDGFIFIGDARTLTLITINDPANVQNAQFKNATIEGVLDGGSTLEDCDINDLNYVNGKILRCGLKGKITLGGDSQASIVNSWSEIAGGGNTPEVDMGGSGNSLVIRGYSGGIELSNCVSAIGDTSIDMDSGQIIFASTISAGEFTVRGVAKVVDNSTGTAIVIDETIGASAAEINVDDIFNAVITGYLDADSFGQWLNEKGLTKQGFNELQNL